MYKSNLLFFRSQMKSFNKAARKDALISYCAKIVSVKCENLHRKLFYETKLKKMTQLKCMIVESASYHSLAKLNKMKECESLSLSIVDD